MEGSVAEVWLNDGEWMVAEEARSVGKGDDVGGTREGGGCDWMVPRWVGCLVGRKAS